MSVQYIFCLLRKQVCISERIIQALDAPELHRDPSALYSVPIKKGQREVINIYLLDIL